MLSEVAEETPSSSVNPHNTQLTPVASVFDEANLLRIVLSQLDLQELCRASLVCRDWLKVCNSDEFWRQVSMEGRVCKPGQVMTQHTRQQAARASLRYWLQSRGTCFILQWVEHGLVRSATLVDDLAGIAGGCSAQTALWHRAPGSERSAP